ncbi:MAG: TIGR03016 family PEP-CTERM system-associated outer membrane protein [Burkholderiaceae bacterium]|nr:TIGR03016 family PEP-CTERM system-associated outer membrane protein [Burkholderiaceae bacterium]
MLRDLLPWPSGGSAETIKLDGQPSLIGLVLPVCAILGCSLGMIDAAAQEPGTPRTPVWRVGASASVSGTDNVGTASASGAEAGLAAELGLDVHLVLPYRRVRGYVDYALTGAVIDSDQSRFEHRNELAAVVNAELIESHAFFDLTATYDARARSAFGDPVRPLVVSNDDRIEGGTVSASPILRARLGQSGRMEARVDDSTTKYRGTDVGDVHTQVGTLQADSGVQPNAILLRGQGYAGQYDFKVGRRTTEVSVRGEVGWAFDAGTVATLVYGREGNNFQSVERTYAPLYGVTIDWRPNERTRISAEGLHRYFGTGHLASFSYRFPRWAVMATSSRSSTTPGMDRTPATGQSSAFDVLFLQLASIEPDEARRRILVQDLLVRNGIDPVQPLVSGLATSSVLLTERHELAVSWTGVRDTVTFGVGRADSERLDTLVSLTLGDDFRVADRVEQFGAQFAWMRRLTPLDTATLSAYWTRAETKLPPAQATTHNLQVQWTRAVSPRSTIAFTLLHQTFDSTTADYKTNVLTCTWRTAF